MIDLLVRENVTGHQKTCFIYLLPPFANGLCGSVPDPREYMARSTSLMLLSV
jgi:hypothetical protein